MGGHKTVAIGKLGTAKEREAAHRISEHGDTSVVHDAHTSLR